MLTHRKSSAKASSLPTILMTPISTKKTKKNRYSLRQMAENLMHALQYNSYGGGAAALKKTNFPSFPYCQKIEGPHDT
ncbi:hypothetical protein V6Z11_D11G244300 [Gossypium hirsutum]